MSPRPMLWMQKKSGFYSHEGRRTGSTRGNIRTPGAWGRTYDSAAEARYSLLLDLRLRAGELTAVKCQKTLPCIANGVLICRRRIDFWLEFPDGHVELHEVKGRREEAFIVRQKAFEATFLAEHPDIRYVEIQV